MKGSMSEMVSLGKGEKTVGVKVFLQEAAEKF